MFYASFTCSEIIDLIINVFLCIQNGELALTVTTTSLPSSSQSAPQHVAPPTADLLGDLLAPLAIEAAPAPSASTLSVEQPVVNGLGESAALALLETAPSVQVTCSH